MNVRKVVAGSVLAAGLGVAGVFGAGTASAAPGISYDPGTGGTGTIGIGDTQSKTGATAIAKPGNQALAVSLIGPSSATATGNADNNNVFAWDGVSAVGGNAHDNNVFTSYGATTMKGNESGNNIVNAGSLVDVHGNAASQTSVSFCGGSVIAAQSNKVTVNKVPGGLC